MGPAAGAREIYPLNEGWRFFYASEPNSDNARFVTLPHSWNNNPTAEGSLRETTGLYQNDLRIPAEWASKRVFIRFYGAQNVTDLFVNGRHAGEHRGGATAFTFEITDKLRFGTDNSLLVIVSNAARTNVLPTSAEMNFYGGLYREAELIVTERTAVSPLYLGTDGVLVHQRTATRERPRASWKSTSPPRTRRPARWRSTSRLPTAARSSPTASCTPSSTDGR